MNRNLLMPVAVSLILLSGCKYNDDNFEGLDDMTQPTNLMKIEYTLTDADYATISSNSTNKKIATDAGVSKDLENVKTNMYLTEKITGAITYLLSCLISITLLIRVRVQRLRISTKKRCLLCCRSMLR